MVGLIQCGNGGAAIANGNGGGSGGGASGGGGAEEDSQTQAGLAGDGTHDGAPKTEQEYADQTGLPMEVAREHVIAANLYTDENLYKAIRAAQKDPANADADFLQVARDAEAYVRNSVPYNGEVYRGFALPSLEAVAANYPNGGTFTTPALTSFSSKPEIARAFIDQGTQAGRRHEVFMRVQNRSGASIQNISNFKDEGEVLVTSQTRYRIVSRNTVTFANSSRTEIQLEEY